jgi:hypothetical protein
MIIIAGMLPAFASPYALQNPAGTNSTSGNTYTSSNNAITVTTDKISYTYGETILISGHTQTFISDIPVAVLIFDPRGNIVKDAQVDLESDRTFSTSVVATGDFWNTTGTFTVRVQQGNPDTASQTTFQITANGQPMVAPPTSTNHNPYMGCPDCNSTSSAQPITTTTVAPKIPNWVKAVFGYYAQGNLSDDDLIKALQFLIQQGIIKVS